METSQEIKQLAKALKAFQKDIDPIGRDAKANYGKYATLGNILKSIKKPLTDNGLSFTQVVEGDNLTTMLMHESGEWMRGTASLKLDKQTAQGQGSAITYARRYNLSALLGLDTDEDDDGNHAETSRQTHQNAPGTTKQSGARKYDYPAMTSANDASGVADDPKKIAAAKDRIVRNVKALGHKVDGKKQEERAQQVAAAVSFELDVDISEAKDLASLEHIGEQLADKAAKKK